MSIIVSYLLSIIGAFTVFTLLGMFLIPLSILFKNHQTLAPFRYDENALKEKVHELLGNSYMYVLKTAGMLTFFYAIIQFRFLFS